jgi:ariadne-1
MQTAANSATSARQVLERYVHYHTRYQVHEQSNKLEDKLREKVRVLKEDLMKRDMHLSWVDHEYLDAALATLHEARRVLKYSYVAAYYLVSGSPVKNLFEWQQQQLEGCVEELSSILEKKTIEEQQRDQVVGLTKKAQQWVEHIMTNDWDEHPGCFDEALVVGALSVRK